jgi:protein CpxP
MTKQVLLAVAVMAGSGAAGAALPHEGAPGRRADRMARLQERLNLSDEQSTRLREIRESRKPEAAQLRSNARTARLDLRRLLESETLDRKAVDAKVKEIADLHAATFRARIDTMLAMREVLTPEQRQKWQALRDERGKGAGREDRGWGRHGRGPGSWGPMSSPDPEVEER